MTIDDRDRGAVFMRWKEKFLVPDHRVQDISGASFAGESAVFRILLPCLGLSRATASGACAFSDPLWIWVVESGVLTKISPFARLLLRLRRLQLTVQSHFGRGGRRRDLGRVWDVAEHPEV
jgi:hypothetical protein